MDEMDYLMDHCIAIDSNRRMQEQFIKPFRLTFKDEQLESDVSYGLIVSQCMTRSGQLKTMNCQYFLRDMS